MYIYICIHTHTHLHTRTRTHMQTQTNTQTHIQGGVIPFYSVWVRKLSNVPFHVLAYPWDSCRKNYGILGDQRKEICVCASLWCGKLWENDVSVYHLSPQDNTLGFGLATIDRQNYKEECLGLNRLCGLVAVPTLDIDDGHTLFIFNTKSRRPLQKLR